MVIVQVIGGLGNQMFQYAYAKSLEERGYTVKLDITKFENYKLHGGYQLDKYDIQLEIASFVEIEKNYKYNFLTKILYFFKFSYGHRVKEKSLLFNKKFLYPNNYNYIEGYFQNEQYFSNVKKKILESFEIKNELSNYTKNIKKDILESTNSCSLHIRRGDYITNYDAQKLHGTCSLSYYKKAINIINRKYENINYFIFSDDMEWVKENWKDIGNKENLQYIESKEKRIPHEDIYLMSLCKHNIIANSSFSWWGAWLNRNYEKVVIAPIKWFENERMLLQAKEIVCSSWIKI